MNTYRIAVLPHYYQPDIQGNNAPHFRDAEYDTPEEARDAIRDDESEIYVTQNGESGRPTLLVVDDRVADYISSGRNEDGSNYDWDNCDCTRNDGDCCGSCGECCDLMISQDRDYIIANAVK